MEMGLKAMPESIFGTQFWFKMKKKNKGSQMGHTDKKILKKESAPLFFLNLSVLN
jgi:hypothetical protein